MTNLKPNKTSGVYKFTNTITNTVYIGSSNNIQKRRTRHINELSKSKHHNVLLQRAWDKYGEASFTFEILCECENYTDTEQHYLNLHSGNSYNIALTAQAPFTGRKHSQETLIKMSNSQKNKPKSQITRHRISVAGTGKHHTEDVKKSIRDGLRRSSPLVEKLDLQMNLVDVQQLWVFAEQDGAGARNVVSGHKKSYKGHVYRYLCPR